MEILWSVHQIIFGKVPKNIQNQISFTHFILTYKKWNHLLKLIYQFTVKICIYTKNLAINNKI